MFEKLDKADWKVLALIADNPYRKFYIREIAKTLLISPSSAKKAADALRDLDLTREEKIGNLRILSGNMEERLLKQIKIARNVDFIKPLLGKLEPSTSIVLYGSFARGENDQQSDIDLLLISNKKGSFALHEYRGFRLQIIKLTPVQWSKVRKYNHAFTEEVKKGIVLKGEIPA
jgi:predicted nucleotidyltransferase